MQFQTSRAQEYISPNVPNVLSRHLWIGAFLLVWPPPLTPTNELRIAVQAIGHEIHDVFLGSLIHKRLHRVASLEQMCIPISNVLQLRALKDQEPLIPQTVLTPGADLRFDDLQSHLSPRRAALPEQCKNSLESCSHGRGITRGPHQH